jgi:hypothetical protein
MKLMVLTLLALFFLQTPKASLEGTVTRPDAKQRCVAFLWNTFLLTRHVLHQLNR